VAASNGVRFFSTVLLFLLLGDVALADAIPLPRPKPDELLAIQEDEAAGQEAAKKPEEPPPPSACFLRLKELAVIRSLPKINKPGGCLVDDVVQLESVILPDTQKVALEPSGTFRCEMAEAVAHWVREELAPAAAAHLGSPLRAVENFDSFSCRGRNRVVGALLSEHGKANALDVRSLKLVNGTAAQPTDPNVPKEFRDGLRKVACARFRTVLGPGSDGYHEDHIHVDLAVRRNDYSLCQWEVRQPIHRVLPSLHIVSYDKPSPHVAPESLPAVAVAAIANAQDKAKPATAPRKL
jgi:hypothetical protein